MGPKKSDTKRGLSNTPTQQSAKKICKKYGKRMTPQKRQRVRRALYDVSANKSSIRQAAEENELPYSFLQRRVSGKVSQFSINGPPTVFSEVEELAMANWLSEMSQRGMGLKMCEFLDFVQSVVKKEKRQTPFKNGRPGKKWYYSFLKRNSNIISSRVETSLELKRSQLTKDKLDPWYTRFREFLQNKDLLNQPGRIYNADETGFNMGGNKSKVIGPTRRDLNVPHISCGKQRLTVMFCGNAAGQMIPPYFVYPEPKPKGYNPLNGSLEGSQIAYTPKGWMDKTTFAQFMDHFNKYAGNERPVVLLFDSVSSHVDHEVFMKAKSQGIELYRIVPNATHLMQPLDKGVFGPLKTKWHMTARKYTRENPGKCIGKENFAEKLKEAFLQFYKPLTVINAFKSSGIYPVDSTVVTKDMLKPSLPYLEDPSNPEIEKENETIPQEKLGTEKQEMAKGALEVFESSLSTPTRQRYSQRIQEGYDVEGVSPCFDVYKKLHGKAYPLSSHTDTGGTRAASGLDILAQVAAQQTTNMESEDVASQDFCMPPLTEKTVGAEFSPILEQSLVFPRATGSSKPKRKILIDSLPDNLTSPESIRQFSLRELEKIKAFSDKEKKAKQKYLKKKSSSQEKKKVRVPRGKKRNPLKGKSKATEKSKRDSSEEDVDFDQERTMELSRCQACHSTEQDDEAIGIERLWIQCDSCDSWMHTDCLAAEIDFENTFVCPRCSK